LFEAGLRGIGVPVGLQENVEHRAGFSHGPLQPEFLARHVDAYFIQEPPGTPPGFSVAQFLSDKRCELDVPLAQRLVTDLNAALVEQLLDVTLTQRKAVVQPEGVLNDAERKTVSIGLAVGHR